MNRGVGVDFSDVLARATNRDEAAFAELWRRHHVPLVRFLRTLGGNDADDLASETWLHAAKALSRFSGDERAFRAWLFTIARRRLVDQHRSASRRPVVAPVAVPEGLTPDAAAEAVERDQTAIALALIGRLPRDQAEVVLLRSIAGLSVDEVAKVIGKRTGTVRVLAHRGLHRLRTILDSDA